jgi:hypothetical protein
MGAVVFAASPLTPTAPVAPARIGLGHVLTGWDGSVWDLMDPTSPVILLSAAASTGYTVTGLGESAATRWSSTAPYVPGSRYRGTQILERPVVLHVGVRASSPAAWVAAERAFRAIMRRDKPMTYTVTLPGVGVFSLACRFNGQPLPFDVSCAVQGFAE